MKLALAIPVDLESIAILEQMRKNFEPKSLKDLASSHEEVGQINFPTVALLKKKEAIKYIEIISRLHGKVPPDFKTFTEGKKISFEGKLFYCFLIAGERRVRAMKLAGWKKAIVQPKVGISAMKALYIQYGENTYVPPDFVEQARAYLLGYKLAKLNDPEISIPTYAGIIGVSPSLMRNRLRFCDLPEKMQEAVDRKIVIYGHALETAKFLGLNITEEKRQAMFDHEIVFLCENNVSIARYKKRIGLLISGLTQHKLFEEPKPTAREYANTTFFKKFKKQYEVLEYFINRVDFLFEKDLLTRRQEFRASLILKQIESLLMRLEKE